ncbi:hypothetical protein PLICRDRAFT_117365 [Plicaturopsis crispa FD-325 SS-3]|uniref:Autophagy-related protein n=1 Tax=Plicaturopsis crispa FD-325 SS-3 TaxID=944288 RepID=A0A0C9T969_PLICR|nr:hypothetical protein PLICRDRAFT_117365 [Plicaturopsis crispa FD-325 SS-3]
MQVDKLAANAHSKQLKGWLSYAFASEVFVIVSLTLFLPICLEQFARDNGVLAPEKLQPCSSSNVESATESRCVVRLGWLWIDTASFSLYVYSISVALQALTVISMGGIADRPSYRKRLLLGFALLGASAAMLFLVLPSSSPIWFLSALLAVVANVGFGASVVAMNAYLPTLARGAPEVAAVPAEIDDTNAEEQHRVSQESDATGDIEQPLLPGTHTETPGARARYDAQLSIATSRISSLGIALGYGAGIALLLVALVPVTKLGGSTLSLRLAIGISGIWWAVFSIPAALWLPGGSVGEQTTDVDWSTRREIIASWKRLGAMLRWSEVKRLRNTFKYLAAWFLLSDGFTTITSTAVLFGKTTLHMQPSALILVGVLTPSAGILGALAWPVLQRRFGWTNLRVLVALVAMASAIPAYGCLGFLPFVRAARWGGLTTQGEMFALAVYFGSVYGAFQSYARAFYAELLPPGEEARWYGLFSITDKVSFLGPLVVGLIADGTGNIRYAFVFLVGMVWLAVPLLASVNVERGRRDARDYRWVRTGGNGFEGDGPTDR